MHTSSSARDVDVDLCRINESEHRYLDLIEDAPDAIVQVDARGVIVLANRTAEQMFGYSRTELLGSNVDLLMPEANRAAHADQRDRFIESGRTRPMGKGPSDLRARQKDGTEFSVEIALSRARNEDGVHVTAVIRDVTDRKRMERELEEARALRNQRIEVLARLSSGLAHEIKNPLAIIHARASDLAEMASEGDVDRAQIEKMCASIVQTSDRAIRILRGIAAMAGTGPHDPMQLASVREIVDQALDLVRGRFTESGILLTTDLLPNLPMVDCREMEISQVLVNLLNNAFDAIDGDSRSERWVRVQVSTQSGAEYENQIERLQIEVVDGGPGVAAEHRDRLMQTFFTTKAVGAGIGIGLSMSRAIAESHGGQLELRECDGHTCFRLTLPVRVAESKRLLHGLEEATVLVVDDEPDLREIFSAWLQHEGYLVFTATNGAEALEVLEARKIDAMVSDIRMPVMDGVALVRTIYERKLAIQSIILVSGYGNVEPSEMYGLGVEAVMEKPLNRKDLLRVLENSLMEREQKWRPFPA